MVRQKRLRLFASYQNYFSIVKQINVHDEFLNLKQWCKVLFPRDPHVNCSNIQSILLCFQE